MRRCDSEAAWRAATTVPTLLNLTPASFLDFGTGTVGSLTFFGTCQNNTTPGALLTLNNFKSGNSFTFNSASPS